MAPEYKGFDISVAKETITVNQRRKRMIEVKNKAGEIVKIETYPPKNLGGRYAAIDRAKDWVDKQT